MFFTELALESRLGGILFGVLLLELFGHSWLQFSLQLIESLVLPSTHVIGLGPSFSD